MALALRLPWDKAQDQWATDINPVLTNPIVQGRLIQKVKLTSGNNMLNHGLGRNLVGWVIVRQRAAATIYDTQDSNQLPNLVLTLNSSAAVVVDLYVF